MKARFMKDFFNSNRNAFNASAARETNLIGEKIHAERILHDMTLEQVRDKLLEVGINVQRAAISKWETGETVPNAYQLLALSVVFGKDSVFFNLFGLEELNFEGRQKVHDYKEDLIATGKYKPEYEDSQD